MGSRTPAPDPARGGPLAHALHRVILTQKGRTLHRTMVRGIGRWSGPGRREKTGLEAAVDQRPAEEIDDTQVMRVLGFG